MFKGLKDLPGITTVALANHRTRQQALRKAEFSSLPSVENIFAENIQSQIKQPADLDGETLNALFHGLEEVPITIQFPEVRTGLTMDTTTKSDLVLEFNTLAYENIFSSWVDQQILQDERFKAYEENFNEVKKSYRQLGFKQAEQDVIDIIKEALKDYPTQLRFLNAFGTDLYDPNFVLLGQKPGPRADPRINSDFELLNYIPKSTSTKQLSREIRKLYDLRHPVRIFLLKNKEMYEMPLSTSIDYKDWLESMHHNINTDKIVIQPYYIPPLGEPLNQRHNWKTKAEGGKYPSPNYIHTRDFINDLGDFLVENNLISEKLEKAGVDAFKDGIIDLLGNIGEDLFENLDKFKLGETYDFIHSPSFVLDLIKIKCEKLISKSKLSDLNQIFQKIYIITGVTNQNLYSQKTRITLRKIAIFLNEKNMLPSNSLENLDDVIQREWVTKIYNDMAGDGSPKNFDITTEIFLVNPIKYILEKKGYQDNNVEVKGHFISDLNNVLENPNLLEEIISKIGFDYFIESEYDIDETTLETIDEFISIIVPYFREVMKYWIINNKFSNYPNTEKKLYFMRLMLAGNLYRLSLNDLGHLLYNSREGVKMHLKSSRIYQDLSHNVIQKNKFSVINWDLDYFESITGIRLSSYELELIRDNILNEINEWILNQPNFIDESLIFHKNGEMKSYSFEALNNIIYATSLRKVYENNNFRVLNDLEPLSFKKLRDKFDIGLTKYLNRKYFKLFHEGLPFSSDPIRNEKIREEFKNRLERIYHTIYKWHEEEFGTRETFLRYNRNDKFEHQRLYYYQQALYSIYQMVKHTFGLVPSQGAKLMQKDYYFDFPSPSISGMSLIESFRKIGKDRLPVDLIANGYDKKYFRNDISYAFHKVFHVCKFRGFDAFFRPLQDEDTLVRHHFRLFAFRKMSSDVNDFVVTTQSWHKTDYEPLFKEMGPRRAEAFVNGLIGTIEELDNLKNKDGSFKEIDEGDLIISLKHNFGAEWKDAYNRILKKNGGDLSDSIKYFNNRGKRIAIYGYEQFLRKDFNSIYKKDLPKTKKIILSNFIVKKGTFVHFKIAGSPDIQLFNKWFPFVRITHFLK